MQILGHSAGTVVETVLIGLCAAGCLFSGVWGLRGRSVWMPDPGPFDGALSNSDGQVVTGRGARVTGALLLLFGLILVYGAAHVWRANAS